MFNSNSFLTNEIDLLLNMLGALTLPLKKTDEVSILKILQHEK